MSGAPVGLVFNYMEPRDFDCRGYPIDSDGSAVNLSLHPVEHQGRPVGPAVPRCAKKHICWTFGKGTEKMPRKAKCPICQTETEPTPDHFSDPDEALTVVMNIDREIERTQLALYVLRVMKWEDEHLRLDLNVSNSYQSWLNERPVLEQDLAGLKDRRILQQLRQARKIARDDRRRKSIEGAEAPPLPRR